MNLYVCDLNENGNSLLAPLIALSLLVLIGLFVQRGIHTNLKVRRDLLSNNAYQEIEDGIYRSIGITATQFLALPSNCSCAVGGKNGTGFTKIWDSVQIGDVQLHWLSPNDAQTLTNSRGLSSSALNALRQCQNQTTGRSGFLVDPIFLANPSDPTDCTMKSSLSGATPTTTGLPSGIFFCLNMSQVTGTSPLPGSFTDSAYAFLRVRYEMTNTEHHLPVPNCRDFATQMILTRLGGTNGIVYSTLYWGSKNPDGTVAPHERNAIYHVPAELDPPMLWIARLYRDALGREPRFEEVYRWWQSYHDQVAANPSANLNSIRQGIATTILLNEYEFTPTDFGTNLVTLLGYNQFWVGIPNEGTACDSTGRFAYRRAAIAHVGVNPNPPGTTICNSAWIATDPFSQWDYAKVIGRDFGGDRTVWEQQGGKACCNTTDASGNLTDTCFNACAAPCKAVIQLDYQNLLGAAPNWSDPSDPVWNYYNACMGNKDTSPTGGAGSAYRYDINGVYQYGGSGPQGIGYALAQSVLGSEQITKWVYQHFVRRDPSSSELAYWGDNYLSTRGSTLSGLIINLVGTDEYFNIRP